MRKSFHMIALTAVLLFTMAAPAVAASKNPRPVVPFSGSAVTSDSYGDPTAAPACPAGAAWRFFAEGTGLFTHLGPVDYHMTHCTTITVFVDGSPAAGTFGPGEITITADNGDELWMVQSGVFHIELTSHGPVSMVDMAWTISGGTGRFTHATGSGTAKAIGDILANSTTGTWSGTISYDASDRSGG